MACYSSEEVRPYLIAFEVFMTGEAQEIRGIAKGVKGIEVLPPGEEAKHPPHGAVSK